MSVNNDKTYVYRAFFGFDVNSMLLQLRKILEYENSALYMYGDDFERIGAHAKAWADFYEKWILNDETVEHSFLEFVENAYLNLKDVYDTASDTLKDKLDIAIKTNNKEYVQETYNHGVVRNAWADED